MQERLYPVPGFYIAQAGREVAYEDHTVLCHFGIAKKHPVGSEKSEEEGSSEREKAPDHSTWWRGIFDGARESSA
jgi:hypothetical protein